MRQITKKQWKTQWDGHFIEVENWRDTVGRTGVRVLIDGVIIAESPSEWLYTVGFCESRIELDGTFEDESGTHLIKVKFGLNRDLICLILVDGKLIGGDTDKELAPTEVEMESLPVAEQKRLLKRQLFVFTVVIPGLCLPVLYLIGACYQPSSTFFPYFYLFFITTFNAIRISGKLRKLKKQDDTKNSTIV